ncbi:beta-N-acetylhexosaminidase [Actinocorallia sp. A-T 12471]|uniref:beta-N-acetylhexosaminidase n=1 Tax=Actinocorallia sp. A-T 12471 TaxID=3089813 RepID=UPI0029CBA3C2|nr:beta-N-acetylhexosaminidase [Actinocorallia sp. A-T 12471]MDX6742917.1 beta-N-acetylhexosaminidase [Actinocorallia sp. A-T 12471]
MEPNLIPVPRALLPGTGELVLDGRATLTAPDGPAAAFLRALLTRATGLPFPAPEPGTPATVALTLDGPPSLGREGYLLDVAEGGVRLRAHTDEGLFRAVQTLRQLLPPQIESPTPSAGPWTLPYVAVEDGPRYAWRGVMLDVARHFFDVAAVKGFIDRVVPYKFNVLHLHLSDDQGWRLEMAGYPRLTEHGSTTAVGGPPGGFFTQDDFKEIVAYAAERYLTVVPEIDVPGHTQAAMSSYPFLSTQEAPELYEGVEVGFSELAIHRDSTYAFLDDVFGELSALTPGGFLHIGGDEALSTTPEDYAHFMSRVLPLVGERGKTVVAWQEAASAPGLPPGVHLQYWRPTSEDVPDALTAAARAGAKLVMSPADRVYLDQKYAEDTELGLKWAGTVSVRQSYEWDPEALVPGAEVAGVEAPLWTETLHTPDDLDHMLFPRLPGVADVAWSAAPRDWDSHARRLRAHTARWEAAGITTYYRAPELTED